MATNPKDLKTNRTFFSKDLCLRGWTVDLYVVAAEVLEEKIEEDETRCGRSGRRNGCAEKKEKEKKDVKDTSRLASPLKRKKPNNRFSLFSEKLFHAQIK